jgi:ureidoacrylate peracid hydrolase
MEVHVHKYQIANDLVERAKAFRGSDAHIFGEIDPTRTAHVIVDLQNGFMAEGAAVEIPVAREIVPNVNRITAAVRAAGGTNIFLRYLVDSEVKEAWPIWFRKFGNAKREQEYESTFTRGCFGFELWPELDVRPTDLIVDKTRFGAFVRSSSNLHDILQERGIDTLIITGTATNVCCESTARDAMQMNYKIIFVADGNAAGSDAEHNATLNNMYVLFADIMTTDELLGFLAKAAPAALTAAE